MDFKKAVAALREDGTLPAEEEIREQNKKQVEFYKKLNNLQLERFNSLIDQLEETEANIKRDKETIKINIAITEYKDKPVAKTAGSIQKEIKNNTEYLTVEELAEALTNGRSFKPGYLNGGTKASDWTEQQVFCVDIDNSLTIQEAIHRSYKFNLRPSFIYPTFSHTEEHNKFRMVFVVASPIKDIRVRNAIQIALMTIFPEADRACKDAGRIFHGTNKELVVKDFNARIEPYTVVQSMISYLKETKGNNYNRSIKNYCQTVGINIINNMPDIRKVYNNDKIEENTLTSIYIIEVNAKSSKTVFNFNIDNKQAYKITEAGEGKKNYNKSKIETYKNKFKDKLIQRFDFDQLENRCKLWSDFIKHERWCYHEEVFGMTTNMWRVKGAETKMIEVIENDNRYDKSNKINTIKSCRSYGYSPMRCDEFCPYIGTCTHNKNMLQQLDLKRHNIRQIKEVPSKTIEEAEKDLAAAINKVYKAKDNKIYVIKAPTGIGKTTALMDLNNYNNLCIAYPNHRLGTDIIERLNLDNYLHLKELNITDKTVLEKYNLSVSKGDFKKAYGVLEQYKNNLIFNNSNLNDPGERKKVADEIFNINSFIENNKRAKDFEGTIYCTHKKLLNLKNNKIDTFLIDEDIVLSSVLQVVDIDIHQLEYLKAAAGQESFLVLKGILKELIEKGIEATEKPGQVVEINSKMYNEKEIKDLIEKYSDTINCNLLDMCKIQYVIADKNGLQGIIKNELPNKKCIILSATASEIIYKKVFKDRKIEFIDLGNVETDGELIFHYGTYSRTKLSDADKINATIKKIKEECPGINNLITYAKFENKFSKEGFNTICHFGACQGLDKYKGEDIIVLGTPHIDNRTYLLIASLIGEKFSISDQIEYNKIQRNGFEFYFNTYQTNMLLQEIQLYLIETELVQAVGRARILRTTATVHLYSSLPLIGSHLI